MTLDEIEEKAQAMLQELRMQRNLFSDRCVSLVGELEAARRRIIFLENELSANKNKEQ